MGKWCTIKLKHQAPALKAVNYVFSAPDQILALVAVGSGECALGVPVNARAGEVAIGRGGRGGGKGGG